MIGDRIKQTREKNGLTQSALAKKLGLSRSAVNAWEMGVSIPSAQYLIELSRLLRVSVDYLLEVDRRETIDISFLDEEEKSIIYSLLNHFDRRRQAQKLLDSSGYSRLEQAFEIMKKSGVELPDELRDAFPRVFD